MLGLVHVMPPIPCDAIVAQSVGSHFGVPHLALVMFLICHCDFVELGSSSPSDLTAEWNYEIVF